MGIVIHFLSSSKETHKKRCTLCHSLSYLAARGASKVRSFEKRHKMKYNLYKTFRVNYSEVKMQLLEARQGIGGNCTTYKLWLWLSKKLSFESCYGFSSSLNQVNTDIFVFWTFTTNLATFFMAKSSHKALVRN